MPVPVYFMEKIESVPLHLCTFLARNLLQEPKLTEIRWGASGVSVLITKGIWTEANSPSGTYRWTSTLQPISPVDLSDLLCIFQPTCTRLSHNFRAFASAICSRGMPYFFGLNKKPLFFFHSAHLTTSVRPSQTPVLIVFLQHFAHTTCNCLNLVSIFCSYL